MMRVLYRVGAGIALYLCASHINDRILFAPFSERSTYGGTHAMAAAVGEENIGRQTRDLEEDLPRIREDKPEVIPLNVSKIQSIYRGRDRFSLLFVFLLYAKERSGLLVHNINRVIEGLSSAPHLDVKIRILLDGSGTVDHSFLKDVQRRASRVVKTKLILLRQNIGLKHSWLSAASYGSFDFVAIVEDDILFSRYVLPYSELCIRDVLLQDPLVIGCSYYVNPHSDITNRRSPGSANPDRYYATMALTSTSSSKIMN